MAVMFLLVTVVSMLWFLFKAGPGRAVIGVATSMFAFAYIGGLGGYAGLLLQRGSSHGVRLLLSTILCVVAYDVVGYFVGSRFGVNTIAPDVSPHKTVEGTLAGVGGSILMGMIVVARLLDWSGAPHHGLLQFACVGFLLGVAALLGDLCESMFKRDLGIKDLGSVLPGHGGFLDRFDGLLFALPVMFFLSIGLNLF
jgi:phosphatidate cytidylyltransferase